MAFCIPRHLADQLKDSALKGEVDIKNLYNMSSKERRAFFSKHTNKDLGKLINTEFEKAMVSKKQDALLEWTKSVFDPEMKPTSEYKAMIDKINSLEELGVLNPKGEKAFLEDLVTDKLGLSVSPKEIKEIKVLAEDIDKAQKAVGMEIGNPLKAEENLKFFEAKKKMDDYLKGKTPASKLKVLTGTIGRGMMLASVKSPVLNIGSNLEVGITEALSRRAANFGIKGTDNSLMKDFIGMANKIYQKTGYDISRMRSLSDAGAGGERVLDQIVHAQGPGAVRKVGRVVEDIVFKQLMGAPDVVFASGHFADSVNLSALKLANGDKKIARELMLDAMKLEPTTTKGVILREQGILDAEKATWTDDSWASKMSLGIRNVINEVSGDLRLGDYVFPFVKTPANVVATGMDYAGMGIPKALVKTVKAWRSGDLGSKTFVQGVTRDLFRAGLGLTTSAILAANTDPEDFVGAYDPNRAQFEQLRNSNTNSFKVGNKWISVDWLGPLSVSYSAMMYAKKYGGSGGEKSFQYGKGVLEQVKTLPGIEDAFDYAKTQQYKKNQSLNEMTGEARSYLISEISSRLMPSFVSDVAKAIDPYDRKATTAWEAVVKKIPLLRQTLPEKKDIFGKTVETEPAWSTILFGARVKTDKSTAITEELYNLSEETGKNVKFTDWDKTSSKKLDQLKGQLGNEKYDELKVLYGKVLEGELGKLIKNPEYKELSAEEKLDLINSYDSEVVQLIMDDIGFEYDPAKNKEGTKVSQETSTQEEYVENRTTTQLVGDYIDAFTTDPLTAAKALFTSEKLEVVKGDLVKLQRFYGIEWNKTGGSQEYKYKLMEEQGIPKSSASEWSLEHITPLAAGGGNEKDNLYLATKEMHDAYTPIDVAMGKAVESGDISRKDAEFIAKKFKVDKTITLDQMMYQFPELKTSLKDAFKEILSQ